MVFHL
jgi:hypothetical protein